MPTLLSEERRAAKIVTSCTQVCFSFFSLAPATCAYLSVFLPILLFEAKKDMLLLSSVQWCEHKSKFIRITISILLGLCIFMDFYSWSQKGYLWEFVWKCAGWGFRGCPRVSCCQLFKCCQQNIGKIRH